MLGAKLYDAAATRALDRYAIEQCGIPGLTLMRTAGAAAYNELRRRWPEARRLSVVCGTGNNGGDGFVVAELAHRDGLEVELIVVGDEARISGDAATCLGAARAAGVEPAPASSVAREADVIVDALLGTGLDREVGGVFAATIARINARRCPCLSIDVPSGLNASSGCAMGAAVTADVTVTFIAAKQGLMTGDGPRCRGEVVVVDLEVPPAAYTAVEATAVALDYAAARCALRPRARTAHKGHFGHVLVVGGAPGYAGAARLAAEAAARAGAGLVSLATHPEHAAGVAAMRPEIMAHAVADAVALRALLKRASVVAIGPGLGRDAWARELLATVYDCGQVQVLDADALNLLAEDPARNDRRIITPHPGEAARLLGVTTASINADRYAAARALHERYGGVAILKGAGTIVVAGEGVPVVIDAGNPGMASGGMGDVLTGVVAALCAQHVPLAEAAALAACVHAHAADCAAAEGGERGLLAGDLAPYIRRALNPLP